MALEGPTGDFAGESPEAPNAHLTSFPNAKKDMFNVGRRQCLEKRNTVVEGNEGSLEDGAEAFMLFLRGTQLILRSNILTVLDLDEVNVTLNNAETIFGLMLSGEGGSANGWRRC